MNIYKNDPFTHHGDGFLSNIGRLAKHTHAFRDYAVDFAKKHRVISKFVVPKITEYMGLDATMGTRAGDVVHNLTGFGFNPKRTDRRKEDPFLEAVRAGKIADRKTGHIFTMDDFKMAETINLKGEITRGFPVPRAPRIPPGPPPPERKKEGKGKTRRKK